MNIIEQLEQNPDSKLKIMVEIEKNEKKPPFTAIGNGRTSRKFTHSVMDTLSVFGKLNPTQQKIVLYFRDIITTNRINASLRKTTLERPNDVILKTKEHKEIKELLGKNSNLKSLREKNIIRKIAHQSYMINPYMFIPSDDFKTVAQQWEELEESNKKTVEQTITEQ
jgi:hypothetical protein